jgi:hypothetical protein
MAAPLTLFRAVLLASATVAKAVIMQTASSEAVRTER